MFGFSIIMVGMINVCTFHLSASSALHNLVNVHVLAIHLAFPSFFLFSPFYLSFILALQR